MLTGKGVGAQGTGAIVAQDTRPAPSANRRRLMGAFALAAGGLFVAIALYRAFRVSWLHFHAAGPLALENPVIAGIMLLKDGFNLYSPAVNQDVPFYIQMYTPAYYYLMAALPEWPGAPFRAGRLVAGFFMVAAALTVLAGARRREHIPIGILMIAFFLSVYPVATNTLLARQDPMALFFAAASIGILLLGGRRRSVVILSATLSVVALTSKQSYIAAPLAVVSWLTFTDRRALRLYATVLLTVGLAFAVVAHLAWGSGFWWSTVGTLPADFRSEFYSRHGRAMLRQATYVVLAVLAVTLILRGLIDPQRRSVRAWFGDLPLAYLTMSGLVLVVSLPKDGASLNYFFEPTLAATLFCLHGLSRMESRRLHYRWAPAIALAFLVALVSDLVRRPVPPAFTRPAIEAQNREDLEAMVAELASLPGAGQGELPETIFIHPTLRNGLPNLGIMPILSDDYLYSILMRDGRLDAGLFVDAVRRQRFDVVVLPLEDVGRDQPGLGDAFLEALNAHYTEALAASHRYMVPSSGGADD